MKCIRCWQYLPFFILLFSILLGPITILAENNNPIKKTDTFFSCAVVSQTRAILVGDRGCILLSDNQGNTWRKVDCPTQEPLASVDFVDENHGWIAGQGGTILHSKDGGDTWHPQTSNTNKYLLAIDFFDVTTGCAVGEKSTVMITTNGGKTWQTSNIQAALPKNEQEAFLEGSFFSVVMLSLREIYIAGEYGRIFVTANTGRTWLERRSPLFDAGMMEGSIIYAMTHDAGALYAVGIDSVFMFSRDRGKTWQQGQTDFSEPELYDICIVGDIGMAVGSGGHVIQTRDRGATWEKVEVPDIVTQAALISLSLRRNDTGNITGVIVGQKGRVGWYKDGKLNW